MSNEPTVDRREFVAGAAAAGLFGLAGCTDDPEEDEELGDEGDRPADDGDETL